MRNIFIFQNHESNLIFYIKKVGAGISGSVKRTAHHRVVSEFKNEWHSSMSIHADNRENSLVLTRVNKLLFTKSHTWVHVKQKYFYSV